MSRGCLRVISLTNELLKYAPSLELQEGLVRARKAAAAPDTLLIVQHHPVFSVGKRGTDNDFLTDVSVIEELGIDVVNVPRGGETTYHGPGQLVAYPILDLRQLGLGARAYVEGLEDAMVHTVGCFGIQARGRVPGKTGVWVGDRKIGAVGVRITHGISSHGIALNVATDLAAYKHIVPCGTPDKEVTTVLQELEKPGQSELNSRSSSASAMMEHNCVWAAAKDNQELQEGRRQLLTVPPHALMTAAEQCLADSIAHVFGLKAITGSLDGR